MFTGLVEDTGRIARLERAGDAIAVTIAPATLDVRALEVGESVAIDGVCLTVTAAGDGRFQVLAGPETLSRTTLGELREGGAVNLERALCLGDRLGGHLVTGHVDGVGALSGRAERDVALDLRVRAPREVARYLIAKGSVALDGVSLTVNAVEGELFDVSLIPHTRAHTTLDGKGVGARVNLEADLIGKYVERFVAARQG